MDIYANKNIYFNNYVINLHCFNPIPICGLQYHVKMKLENELKSLKKYLCFLGSWSFKWKR
jgi:hypothetical protein